MAHAFIFSWVREVGLGSGSDQTLAVSPSSSAHLVGTWKRVSKDGGNIWHEMAREGSRRGDKLRTRRYKVEYSVKVAKMDVGGFLGRPKGAFEFGGKMGAGFLGKNDTKIS